MPRKWSTGCWMTEVRNIWGVSTWRLIRVIDFDQLTLTTLKLQVINLLLEFVLESVPHPERQNQHYFWHWLCVRCGDSGSLEDSLTRLPRQQSSQPKCQEAARTFQNGQKLTIQSHAKQWWLKYKLSSWFLSIQPFLFAFFLAALAHSPFVVLDSKPSSLPDQTPTSQNWWRSWENMT